MKKIDKKAFTLIELLVVVAVIGILVLLGMPRFIGYTEKAELRRIQHDVKVMEQEVGTVFVSNGDDVSNGDEFNSWEDNSKDLNQLAKENKLFEKEGIAEAPIGGQPYKVIPEKYKYKINTKLKGTFYANKDGKVYYEHEKPLFGMPAESEEENKDGIVCYVHEKPILEITIEPIEPKEKEPEYSDEEIQGLIAEGYIPIATAEDLDSIRNDTPRIYGEGTEWKKEYTGGLDKHYVQVANIDLSGYSEEGWTPIGTGSGYYGETFRGTYDGGNYVITNLEVKNDNLEVKNDNDNYQGLFGSANGAAFSNIGLIDNKVTGSLYNQYTGGLVGDASSSTISNSYATGSITGSGIYVGGLVGSFSGTIENSYTTGDVTGTNEVGGLVGYANTGTKISSSYTTGSVTGTRQVGGLVGYTGYYDIEIINSYTTGSVTGGSVAGVSANRDVGGLVGEAGGGIISNSYSTASVETAYSGAGGLVGRLNSGAKVTNSYATGSITFTGIGKTVVGGAEMGGLVGDVFGTIENSYATGDVTGNGKVGGLAGNTHGGTVRNSYATGSVTGISGPSELIATRPSSLRWYTGGLVGNAYESTIENSYATGSVEGRGPATGGLVGEVHNSTISNSSSISSVEGKDNVGGLVGRAYKSTISNSSATGSVTGTGTTGLDLSYSYVEGGTGGLVGYAYNSTEIINSCAAGPVEGTGPFAGGLVGEVREGTIGNSFAEGSVKGTEEVGGLVGKARESSTISNSYARGLVTGTNEVGGLVGLVEDSTISNSYWDKKTTKQTTSAGQDESFGKTTEEMKNQTTYSGWDFTNIWEITSGNYPTLR